MPPKRKVVYLSRFFEENVQLVANMCVKCYEQEEEVKVIGINRTFIDLIKSRRLECIQKKQKLDEAFENNPGTIYEDISRNKLHEGFEDHSSVSYNSDELYPCRDFGSPRDTEFDKNCFSNLTSTSKGSLGGTSLIIDDSSSSDTELTSSVIENSSTSNSYTYINANEDKYDQIYDNSSSINGDVIASSSKSSNTVEDNSVFSNKSVIIHDATFKNRFKKSNDTITQSSHNSEECLDKIEINTQNNSYSLSEDEAYENNLKKPNNNILNKLNFRRKVYEDTSSDESEENFGFSEDHLAKTKCEVSSNSKNTTTSFSQSIFKTLNSKNSRLYEDSSTNIHSNTNFKQKSTSSSKCDVNKLQLTDCSSINNADITSLNNDKRRGFPSKHNDQIKLVEKTRDDSIAELINRIHSPVEFLCEDNLDRDRFSIKSKSYVDEDKDEDSIDNLIKHIRSSVECESTNIDLDDATDTEAVKPKSVIEETSREQEESLVKKETEKSLIEERTEDTKSESYVYKLVEIFCRNEDSTVTESKNINGEKSSIKLSSLKFKVNCASSVSSQDPPEEHTLSQYFAQESSSISIPSQNNLSSERNHNSDIISQDSLPYSSNISATQAKLKSNINFASLRKRICDISSNQVGNEETLLKK